MQKKTESISLTENNSNKSAPTSPTHSVGDDYDPHLHRNVPHPTNNFETLVHMLKGALGTGILAMPQAFANSGYVSGILNTFLLGLLCTYCLHVLVKTQYKLCKKHRLPILTYPESMRMALEEGPDCLKPFAPSSALIVDIFLIIYQLGVCCVYIVFVAANIKQLVDDHIFILDVKIHMLILLIPLILLNFIPNLKILAPFSTFANVITFVGLGCILYYIFKSLPSIDTRVAIAAVSRFPLFFGTVLFALEAVGVVIALENNMKTPKKFGGWFGVLNVGMFFITVLYAGMGFMGYLRYGEEALGSITLNIPSKEPVAIAIRIMFSIAIFISYGLQCYVPVEILWKTYLYKRYANTTHEVTAEYILRISIVLITFLLAVAIPQLGLFISLFGAFCLSALGIAFPAIMELCVAWPDNLGRCKYIIWKDITLIILGMTGLLAGTYTSLHGIVQTFLE